MSNRFPRVRRSLWANRVLMIVLVGAVSPVVTLAPQLARSELASSTPVNVSPAEQSAISAINLARYLKAIGAKMYGAYWCPHCHHQRELFGRTAFTLYVNYIECDPHGYGAQPERCQEANIEGYPTWEIKGQFYPGVRSLAELAELSGYQAPRAINR